mmetsp:Transcript_29408/g.68475  ORF Transcript_29408/g.68475 Transcript_29408/m.68475 type:complete len:127 (-) Transcript_29408:129-509(-)
MPSQEAWSNKQRSRMVAQPIVEIAAKTKKIAGAGLGGVMLVVDHHVDEVATVEIAAVITGTEIEEEEEEEEEKEEKGTGSVGSEHGREDPQAVAAESSDLHGDGSQSTAGALVQTTNVEASEEDGI